MSGRCRARPDRRASRAKAEAQAAQLEPARAEQAAALASLRSQVAGWEQQVQEAQQVSRGAGAADGRRLVRATGRSRRRS